MTQESMPPKSEGVQTGARGGAPDRTQPHVTIILVTFKAKADTLDCLQSLSEITYKNFTVILVDQNSGDGTPEAVRARYPWVRLIENPVNNGFTGGNNVALKQALSGPTDFLFLLNNDTVVEPGLIEKLLAPLERDPRIGIIGPAMLFYKEPTLIWWAGSHVDWRGRPHHDDEGKPIDKLDQTMRETGYVCGCGMMIRRSVLEQIGILDDRFFIYYEESDLCARARRAGWKIMLLPSARLWHKVSRVTEIIGGDFGTYHGQRNVLLYVWKNSKPGWLALLIGLLLALKGAAVHTLKGRRHTALVVLRALRDALTGRWGATFFTYKRG